ncbi:hypothetical protein [Actinomadura madurae]|uniref:hypothetical protein n=1 Tax=Actinomadura madurae TaxID=1993 RepID=UPI0020D232DE|nr:hypothetical protein [Actinomadura madurae]MCP9983340.1 hypothetical protein [Actinomadura madurae]
MAGPHTRSHRTPALACAALAACAALTACGDDSGTAGPSPSSPGASSPAKDSPAGEQLVLRRRQTGGIAGLGGPGSVPEFSLYSTGRAVVSSQGRLTEYRLKPDALRRLLDEARAAGLGRSHTVGSDRIADAIITVVGMGGATTRIIQPESQAGPEARFLKRLDPAGLARGRPGRRAAAVRAGEDGRPRRPDDGRRHRQDVAAGPARQGRPGGGRHLHAGPAEEDPRHRARHRLAQRGRDLLGPPPPPAPGRVVLPGPRLTGSAAPWAAKRPLVTVRA